MAFDYNPSGYFPGINTSAEVGGATGVFIPYEDLESYNADVVANNSGDIRQLVYSFGQAVADQYLSLDTNDRFSNVTVARNASVPNDNTIRRIYTITCNLEIGDVSVQDE